jgi:hypothetical protein
MDIQHIKSTSVQTENLSEAPPNTKLTLDTLPRTRGAESHVDTQMSKRQYILCSISHVHPNIKKTFLSWAK